ncbi:MAG: hypothetical protein V4643_03825 [Bacteroidota bacterium]
MRYLFLFFLLTQSVLSYSQFLVGDSKVLAKSVLEKEKIKFTENKLTDSTHRISWIVENEYQMILIFNTDNIITKQTIIPEKENGVNEFVKWFNKDFVIISNTEWRNYANGRIYNIKLKYILREPFFSITLDSISE